LDPPDDIGRPAIARVDAARLIAARRAAVAFRDAERARREAEAAARRPPILRGVPAIEGATAFESLLAVDADDREPSVYQRLLDEELARGKRS
jgi:hypothetical protein